MFRIEGETKTGVARSLDIKRLDDGRVHLWIHGPESTDSGGYEIFVPADELLQQLRSLGLTVAWSAPGA